MAKIQFLTILLTVTCFLGGVVSVTDKEFEVCTECDSTVMFGFQQLRLTTLLLNTFVKDRFSSRKWQYYDFCILKKQVLPYLKNGTGKSEW